MGRVIVIIVARSTTPTTFGVDRVTRHIWRRVRVIVVSFMMLVLSLLLLSVARVKFRVSSIERIKGAVWCGVVIIIVVAVGMITIVIVGSQVGVILSWGDVI